MKMRASVKDVAATASMAVDLNQVQAAITSRANVIGASPAANGNAIAMTMTAISDTVAAWVATAADLTSR